MSRKRAQRVSEVGQCIRRTVKQNPGIHFRGLGRAAHVTSAGQLRHHLDRLERQGVLVEVEDGRYKRFFVAGEQDAKLRPEMARFTRVVPRRIAKLLLLSPMNRSQLRRSLGCADSTLGYHLSRMVSLGDLARERGPSTCIYSLASEETVRRLLMASAKARAGDGTDPVTADATASPQTPPTAALKDPLPAPAPTTQDALDLPPQQTPDEDKRTPEPAPQLPEPIPDLMGAPDHDFGLTGLPI